MKSTTTRFVRGCSTGRFGRICRGGASRHCGGSGQASSRSDLPDLFGVSTSATAGRLCGTAKAKTTAYGVSVPSADDTTTTIFWTSKDTTTLSVTDASHHQRLSLAVG